VQRIATELGNSIRIQTGGGVRSVEDAQQLADAGVSRVVMGSAAVREPQLVDVVARVVDVAVGLDHRNGEVATDGWLQGSTLTLADAVTRYPAASAFVITDISRDGMLAGPDVDGLRNIASLTTTPVIASGGVAELTDLRELRDVRGLAGVIVGKAIYEGRFSVREALRALQA
jgi:phosphoribosylformimino-5-aminoimidazole carboxamide ribotide isomerase